MIWIFGASGHGKVILDILELNKIPVAGFIDDNERIQNFMGLKVIRRSELVNNNPNLIIGIGDNTIRKQIAETVTAAYPIVIHPSATVSVHSTIADGTVVMAQSAIQPG